MGCAPSLHTKQKRGRNSDEFSLPENNDVDRVCQVPDKGSSNNPSRKNSVVQNDRSGNGRLAYLDDNSVDSEDIYKKLQQMRSGRGELMVGEMLVTNNQELKVLLVFDEEDETTEALISALCALRFTYTLKDSEESAFDSFSSERYQLIIIDHRNHSTLNSLSLCRSLRATNGGECPTIVAVVNKSCVDEHEQVIIPVLSAGFNRLFVETCSIKTCLLEFIQLEHNLVRYMNKLAVNEALYSALDGTSEAIQIIDASNRIQYINKASEKILGYNKADLVGSSIQDIYGRESLKSECTSETNGKNCEGSITIKKRSGECIPVQYRITFGSHLRNPAHVIYIKDKSPASSANKPNINDASYDVHNYLRGSVKSTKRPADFKSSSSDSGVPLFSRRQSVAKLHAMTIEAPITKVISIITAVSENSPPGVASSLETVLDILRSTELYNPQHLTNQSLNSSEDQTTTDLVGGLLHQDPKKPTQSMYRRQSQENSSLKGYNQGCLQLIPDFDSAPSTIKSILMKESQWDFNVIELEKLTTKRPLVWLGMMIFARFDLCERLQCDERILHKWLTLMEANYHSKNSYHNSTHAADVFQATAYFLQTNRLKMMFDSMDEIACLIAAVIHDVDHPGKTSAFLCNSNNHLAILYNDLAVLESHHSALAFKLTRSSDKVNIFQNLDSETYRSLRKSIVDMVLATEMTKHFEHLSKFINVFTKPAFNAPEILPVNTPNQELDVESLITPENIVLIKRILIKCADVNNPLRPLSLSIEWAHRIAEEYFAQTDDEKKLNIPVMMPAFDRATCNIAKSQIGFIDYFINDMFAAWDAFVDMPELMTHLKNSYNYWKEQERISVPNEVQSLSDVEELNFERDECSTEDESNQVTFH